MKAKKMLAMSAVVGVTLLSFGCGKRMSGTYTLTVNTLQTQYGGVQNSSCQSSQSTIVLAPNGDFLSGSSANNCYSQQLQGKESGDQLTEVTLTLTPFNQFGYYTSGGSNQTQTQTSCVYTGSLNFIENQLSGTLILQNQPQAQQGQYTYSACQSAVTITGTKND